MRFLLSVIVIIGVFSISLALVTQQTSASDWDCLSLGSSKNHYLFDVWHGAYFHENESKRPASVADIFWSESNQMTTYEYFGLLGQHRIGVVDNKRAYGQLDDTTTPSKFTTARGTSPDNKFIAISTVDQAQQTLTVTLHDVASFVPILATTQPYEAQPDTPASHVNQFAFQWSRDSAWFSFSSSTSQIGTLTFMSVKARQSQTIQLRHKIETSVMLWSPTEDAVAVLSSPTRVGSYDELDLFVLRNNRWELEQSQTAYKAPEYPEGGTYGYVLFSADGRFLHTTMSDLPVASPFNMRIFTYQLGNPTAGFRYVGQFGTVSFELGATWMCTTSAGSTQVVMVPLTETHAPIPLPASQQCTVQNIPNQSAMIVKFQDSTNLTEQWVGLHASPINVTPLVLPEAGWVMQGNAHSQIALFFSPKTTTANNVAVGQIAIINLLTWQTTLVSDMVAYNIVLSPDGERIIAVDTNQTSLLLFSKAGQLVARLPIGPYHGDNIYWTPNSEAFAITLDGKISMYNRDGQFKSVAPLPPELVQTSNARIWSDCEPSTKLPYKELPQ